MIQLIPIIILGAFFTLGGIIVYLNFQDRNNKEHICEDCEYNKLQVKK